MSHQHEKDIAGVIVASALPTQVQACSLKSGDSAASGTKEIVMFLRVVAFRSDLRFVRVATEMSSQLSPHVCIP